jgi:hypothetical protein
MRNGPPQFVPPTMDFGIAAFDLRGEGDAQLAREPSVIPILEPPPEGFVRSPVEEDVLVCPGCERELGVGGDEEVKRQVWLVRKCGHVSFSSLLLVLLCDLSGNVY